jgi:cold shock CspA family protein
MRTHGTLAQWNDERGFGFIAPAQGHGDLFVHVSAFPRDGKRPQIGEQLSFEIEAGPQGKPRAVRVMRAGASGSRRARAPRERARHAAKARGGLGPALLALVVLAAIVAVGHINQRNRTPVLTNDSPSTHSERDSRKSAALFSTPDAGAGKFKCDGRTHCSQMTSCEEATYFLQNCPNTQMDGNHDGEPCEQQWCNSQW